MAALLHRMRGGEEPAVVVEPDAPQRNKRKSDSRPAVEIETPAPPEEVPVVDMPRPTGELQRRTRPDLETDLSAMRELANIQARAAIDTHGKKRLLNRVYGTLGTSLISLVVGLFVLAFSDRPIMRAGALLILVVGIYLLVSSLLSLKGAFGKRQKTTGLRAIIEEVEAELAAKEREEAAEHRQEHSGPSDPAGREAKRPS